MKLGMFTMPVHPQTRSYTETLKEDREATILADRLGYCEAFFGEHLTDACETITSPLAFISSLVSDTKTIKLCTGTINLPNHHPAQVAAEVAMVDHLLEGRFMFGISPGGLRSDAEIFGNLDADRTAMLVESIDHILAIWSGEPPYRREGKYWNFSTERTLAPAYGQGIMVKPYQAPHPPIVVTAVAPFSKGLVSAAERGWLPISANFLQPAWVASHWPKYKEGCEKGGHAAEARNWRVAKSIFVADDDKVAARYGKGPDGPYSFYFRNLMAKLVAGGRSDLFKHDRSMADSDVTFDYVLDSLVVAGSVSSVVDQLLAFREKVGDFGTLLYCAHDWVDAGLGKRSMELMATKVMPEINKALGASAEAA